MTRCFSSTMLVTDYGFIIESKERCRPLRPELPTRIILPDSTLFLGYRGWLQIFTSRSKYFFDHTTPLLRKWCRQSLRSDLISLSLICRIPWHLTAERWQVWTVYVVRYYSKFTHTTWCKDQTQTFLDVDTSKAVTAYWHCFKCLYFRPCFSNKQLLSL